MNLPLFQSLCITIASSTDFLAQTDEILEFPAGLPDGATRCINVPIMEDVEIEGSETFLCLLTLVNTGMGVTLGNSMTMVTIVDNEG